MQITMNVIVHFDRDYKGGMQYHLFSSDMSVYGYIPVADCSIAIDLPDDFDPVSAEINMLRNKADKARVKVNMIQERISKLLCLEHKPDLCDDRR